MNARGLAGRGMSINSHRRGLGPEDSPGERVFHLRSKLANTHFDVSLLTCNKILKFREESIYFVHTVQHGGEGLVAGMWNGLSHCILN